MAIVFSTTVFGIEKMVSTLENIFSKPETIVDFPKTMVSAVGEPAAIV
jgi:hypothetical protein